MLCKYCRANLDAPTRLHSSVWVWHAVGLADADRDAEPEPIAGRDGFRHANRLPDDDGVAHALRVPDDLSFPLGISECELDSERDRDPLRHPVAEPLVDSQRFDDALADADDVADVDAVWEPELYAHAVADSHRERDADAVADVHA